MKARWVISKFFDPDNQSALNHGINYFGATLFAESLEEMPDEVQAGGYTLMVRDHHGKIWYVTATTTPPEVIE